MPGRKAECQKRAREGQKEPGKVKEGQKPERAREKGRMHRKWTLNLKATSFDPKNKLGGGNFERRKYYYYI